MFSKLHKISKEKYLHRWKASCLAFFLKWHLPLMFLVAIIIGLAWSEPGRTIGNADINGFCFKLSDESDKTCYYDSLSNFIICIIFIISGVNLKTDEVKTAMKECKAAVFGIISILFLSPLITFWIIHWDFKVKEFAVGLSLFFSQATTLSSGTVITSQAKGNVALALLLTLSTNIIAVGTMPLFVVHFLKEYSSSSSKISLQPTSIIVELLFILLIPLIAGKMMRFFTFIQSFSSNHSVLLTISSSFCIAFTVWITVSTSSDDFETLVATDVVLIIVASLGIHLFLLLFNFMVSRYLLKIGSKEERAVTIVASQKTLPVSLSVLASLSSDQIGSKGLVTVALISAQVCQVVFDAFLAAYWAEIPYQRESFDDLEGEKEIKETEKGEDKNPSSTSITLT